MAQTGHFKARVIGAALTLVVGGVLCFTRLATPLERASYDFLFRFQRTQFIQDIIILRMDEASHRDLDQTFGRWSRRLHARLLKQLTRDQAKLVVFDVFLADPSTNEVDDAILADAIKENGRVVLAADLAKIAQQGAVGTEAVPPRSIFTNVAAAWGIHVIDPDSDDIVRRCLLGRDPDPSLSWAAAGIVDSSYRGAPPTDEDLRWIHYYGPPYKGIYGKSYYSAFDQKPGFFKDKFVFIGGKPGTVPIRQMTDQYSTPYSRWADGITSGVEIQATMFANLIHHDWLTQLSLPTEWLVIIGAALLLGGGLATLRPGVAAAVSLGVVVGGTALSVWVILRTGVWFSWVTIVGAQVPCAFLYTALRSRATPLDRAERSWEAWARAELAAQASRRGTGASSAASSPNADTQRESTSVDPDALPTIADHEVLRCIGQGGYGAVWLARNAVGLYHAVKVVYRRDFKRAQPYEREFRGIKNFMPVSFNHTGLVHLLHVGRSEEHGYFYYIMELGDDDREPQPFDPAIYTPRTMATVIKARGPLPVKQCLQWFVPLADALAYLHQERLVHRDVKPSNIIFVRGVPKLADIGLVTGASIAEDSTCVGTEGFIPPEGPGTTAADIFGFGKVMYEACTGRDRREYPAMPTVPAENAEAVRAFMLLVKRACESNPQARYASIRALHADLVRLSAEMRSPGAGEAVGPSAS